MVGRTILLGFVLMVSMLPRTDAEEINACYGHPLKTDSACKDSTDLAPTEFYITRTSNADCNLTGIVEQGIDFCFPPNLKSVDKQFVNVLTDCVRNCTNCKLWSQTQLQSGDIATLKFECIPKSKVYYLHKPLNVTGNDLYLYNDQQKGYVDVKCQAVTSPSQTIKLQVVSGIGSSAACVVKVVDGCVTSSLSCMDGTQQSCSPSVETMGNTVNMSIDMSIDPDRQHYEFLWIRVTGSENSNVTLTCGKRVVFNDDVTCPTTPFPTATLTTTAVTQFDSTPSSTSDAKPETTPVTKPETTPVKTPETTPRKTLQATSDTKPKATGKTLETTSDAKTTGKTLETTSDEKPKTTPGTTPETTLEAEAGRKSSSTERVYVTAGIGAAAFLLLVMMVIFSAFAVRKIYRKGDKEKPSFSGNGNAYNNVVYAGHVDFKSPQEYHAEHVTRPNDGPPPYQTESLNQKRPIGYVRSGNLPPKSKWTAGQEPPFMSEMNPSFNYERIPEVQNREQDVQDREPDVQNRTADVQNRATDGYSSPAENPLRAQDDQSDHALADLHGKDDTPRLQSIYPIGSEVEVRSRQQDERGGDISCLMARQSRPNLLGEPGITPLFDDSDDGKDTIRSEIDIIDDAFSHLYSKVNKPNRH